MRGKGVAQRVTRNRLGNARHAGGVLHRFVQGAVVQVMPAIQPGSRINAELRGGKHPLPAQLLAGVRVFLLQRVRQPHPGQFSPAVLLPEDAHVGELFLQRGAQRRRQHDNTILIALTAPNGDLSPFEVHILDAQPQTLQHAQARAVHQAQHHAGDTLAGRQHPRHLLAPQHGGQPPPTACPRHIGELPRILLENRLVQKQDGRQGLILCA